MADCAECGADAEADQATIDDLNRRIELQVFLVGKLQREIAALRWWIKGDRGVEKPDLSGYYREQDHSLRTGAPPIG